MNNFLSLGKFDNKKLYMKIHDHMMPNLNTWSHQELSKIIGGLTKKFFSGKITN